MPTDKLLNLRVVICSDDPVLTLQIQRVLQIGGLVVTGVAADGRAARSMILRRRPDIIIMDKALDMSDGYIVAKALLRTMPTCVILMLSPSDEHMRGEAVKGGITLCITKPIEAVNFLFELEAAWTQFETRRPPPANLLNRPD